MRLPLWLLASLPLLAQTTGDPVSGKALFEGKGQCLSCHRVNGNGSRVGPDLSDIGLARRTGGPGPLLDAAAAGNASALERAIVDPDADIAPANRFVKVITKDGKEVTGRLLNHDNFSVQFIDTQGKLRSFLRSDAREISLIAKSPMPSYRGKLTPTEIADLVAYLSSLKGLENQ